ncbi:MAG: GIY-YIG nuclease family protein [Selenomonas sp.]|nr:GIY-YIG nuclease family protein [Selenomonas sp.]
MLECRDGSLYVGWTDDLEKRIRTHQAGRGGKYTRSRLPVRLAYFEELPDKSAAMSREWHLKRLSHQQKLALIDRAGQTLYNK